MVYDFIAGGAQDERTLQANLDSYRQWRFVPRRLVDLRHIDTSTTLMGKSVAFPAVIAPTGLNGLYWPDGDVALARAAQHSNIPFTLSTASSQPLEHVAQHAGGRLWFQLYVIEQELARSLVERAKNSGYECLVVTVDVVVNGKRERDLRNRFGMPLRLGPDMMWDVLSHPGWAWRYLRNGKPVLGNFNTPQAQTATARAALLSRSMDAGFDWAALEAIRQQWPHKMLVKGVLHPDDIKRCQAMGMDGVVLSNHGGRQLDDACTALEALTQLPVLPDFDVLVDGGIRRGSDIAKAVALGARAVMLGRATLYGLASNGETGARNALDILHKEYKDTLVQLGCPATSRLGPHCVRPVSLLSHPHA